MKLFVLLLVVCSCLVSAQDPSRFKPYLQHNKWASGLPQSYYVPPTYFDSIPLNQRPNFFTEGRNEPLCNNQFISAANLNAYQFQTETILATTGLNLYDAAMWQISLALLGDIPTVQAYQANTLVLHKTLQFPDIRADKPCKGVMTWGQCNDASSDGSCGLCYGDGSDKNLDIDHAYFFRMISDVWSYDGTQDARCPTLNGNVNTWKWNDYRPVLGENAWANLIGPLQVAYLAAGKTVNGIPDNSGAFTLALSFIAAVEKMSIAKYGAVYYAPRNTYDQHDPDVGSTISTENNISLLGGLKMLLYILTNRSSQTYNSYIPRVQLLISQVEGYIKSAYIPSRNYFSQGARFDPRNGNWTWHPEPFFAVDVQTWGITVLGKTKIDSWFGDGTTDRIWTTTKQIGGYRYNSGTNYADGVGFTDNSAVQVFSSEWTLGATNMLRVIAAQTTDQNKASAYRTEADYMRQRVEMELTTQGNLKDGTYATGVKYANKRYYIPFGWYANPIWNTAALGWAAVYDLNFNPFYLGGKYASDY